MHECTEQEMRETDRVWKTHGSQMLAVQLDTVTGFPGRLGEASSMLMVKPIKLVLPLQSLCRLHMLRAYPGDTCIIRSLFAKSPPDVPRRNSHDSASARGCLDAEDASRGCPDA